ncbi:MAG: TAXI family TRAP transporter solute-binding subunit [Gammaproteobacteria bacterium]|nr:TAXI family TRAP transporter solute-binding subunit [Gammaproteobacteria bacterium]
MPRPERGGGPWLAIYGPALLVMLAGFVVAYQFVEPAPPERLTLATGGPGGAYHLFGQRYREQLARHGVEVELRNTAGSVENLELLREGEVDVAFVQGGIADPGRDTGMEALASLYHEPLWVFHTLGEALEDLRGLAGKHLAVGAVGSGTRPVALQLLRRNGIDAVTSVQRDLSTGAAVEALRGGVVDAAFFVAAPNSPVVAGLLQDPDVRPLGFRRAEAYTRQFDFLSRVTLVAGQVDLAAGIPAEDVPLVAPTANLVAGETFHPALAVLLLQAAETIHGTGDGFSPPGTFPSNRHLELPLSDAAERFHARGPPFLQRYLPFWAATLIDRMAVMLVPLLTLLLPLFKIVPPTYRWRVRSRIYRWYRDLRLVERHVFAGADEPTRAWADDELDRIEAEVAQLQVPLSYADQLFNLRLHIRFVRRELRDA